MRTRSGWSRNSSRRPEPANPRERTGRARGIPFPRSCVAASMVPFHPRPPWLTGRLQTIRALRWPFPAALTEGHRLWLPLADGDALAAMLHFPEAPRHLPLAVLVHGL